MIQLRPEQIAELWEADGSLRDVYAERMTIDRWRSFLTLSQQSNGRYTSNGEPAAAPDAVDIFSDRTRSHLLAMVIEGVQINCHFFIEDELELDIDPRQVVATGAHAAVLRFLETVAATVKLPLSLTPENMQSKPYLSYEPRGARWTWHE